ncbi:hypothetical protein CHS0354_034980 [Potamilus streckersoni]|uniref:Uncharacterized protein n=1 Tax=Potamilus streckersoni TaxID=2493646 RepID=A0AAE0SEH1_9BIVA|nr:hypothetical protein CHS0354_034980 [Potamilus streckersoni]
MFSFSKWRTKPETKCLCIFFVFYVFSADSLWLLLFPKERAFKKHRQKSASNRTSTQSILPSHDSQKSGQEKAAHHFNLEQDHAEIEIESEQSGIRQPEAETKKCSGEQKIGDHHADIKNDSTDRLSK